MPKIFPNLQQTLLDKTALILREEGYSALSIRRIAAECHVATGTVYNYFKSKDEMIAGIMLHDWSKTVDDMKNAVTNVSMDSDDPQREFSNGMVSVTMSIRNFNRKHAITFGQFEEASGSLNIVQKYHHLLRDQIDNILLNLIENTGNTNLRAVIPVLSETILTVSQRDDIDNIMIREFAEIISA